jgi:hypothetical protein
LKEGRIETEAQKISVYKGLLVALMEPKLKMLCSPSFHVSPHPKHYLPFSPKGANMAVILHKLCCPWVKSQEYSATSWPGSRKPSHSNSFFHFGGRD